jgi:enamidase
MNITALINIGALVSGKLEECLLEADTIIIEGDKIAAIGRKDLLADFTVEKVIDVKGMTVTPGLIDSHCHPVLGDFTPRQKTMDYLDSSLHGGVTTFISAGEAHTPGRPKDVEGVKALAVLAHKSFANLSKTGYKVHGGAVILEPGLGEEDFRYLAGQGVWLVGEIGLGGVKTVEEAAPLVKIAKKYGMKVMMHTGGTSIPGSSSVNADMVMQINPTVVSHINGGTTAISQEEVVTLIEKTKLPLEIVQCGNPRIADFVARTLTAKGELARIIIGNDSPSGSGIIPLGILRTINQLASMSQIAPAEAIAMATGNTARVFDLNVGIIEAGRLADLVVMDAPIGSVGADALSALSNGDLPGIDLVITNGQIAVEKSRNTPPSARKSVMSQAG